MEDENNPLETTTEAQEPITFQSLVSSKELRDLQETIVDDFPKGFECCSM